MPLPEQSRLTHADLLGLPDTTRNELIDGELFLQASPSITHARITRELFSQFSAYLHG